MMESMGTGDDFAEFETTEDQIDAMMAAGEPVDVDVPGERPYIESLYVVTGAPSTQSWSSSLTPNVGTVVGASVRISMPVNQSVETAA